MHVDDTAHKVYISSLDDELSDSESSSDETKVIFHPDLKKHLLANRIPDHVRADAGGNLAGINSSNELVLYDVPQSLTVSQDRDNVRKAIIESRARAREAQRKERETFRTAPVTSLAVSSHPKPSAPYQAMTTSDHLHLRGAPDTDAMDID